MDLCSRRDFLTTVAGGAGAALLCGGATREAVEVPPQPRPIVVFSKVFQQLQLDFDEVAALTAEAGLDGVDCPVRAGGEIPPERAEEELPRYVAALKRRQLTLPLLTTGITSTTSPFAEKIITTAQRLGVQYYRLGFITRESNDTAGQQLREIKAQLERLARLNRRLGIGALLQNHSPAGKSYVGGDLGDLYALVKDIDPAQVGIAFDIGHALVVHGDAWRHHFERLRPHLKIAYVKDVTRAGRWVAFGQGDIEATGYFKLLQQLHYRAPVCLHIEYDWSDGSKNRNRATLLKTLQDNTQVLRKWLPATGGSGAAELNR